MGTETSRTLYYLGIGLLVLATIGLITLLVITASAVGQ